jgi:hypothetical protein
VFELSGGLEASNENDAVSRIREAAGEDCEIQPG